MTVYISREFQYSTKDNSNNDKNRQSDQIQIATSDKNRINSSRREVLHYDLGDCHESDLFSV